MKEKSTLEGALQKTIHHSSEAKVALIIRAATSPEEIEEHFEYRFKLIRENLQAVTRQVKLIEEAAKRNDAKEVLRLLEEKAVEAGHDDGKELPKAALAD